MRIRLAVLLFSFSLSAAAHAQTHCGGDEIDYFSCKITKSEKVISVCGNIADGNLDNDSWLQYRFGKIGQLELTYPTEKTESLDLFEGIYFSKYGDVLLRLINNQTLYEVFLSERYETPKKTLQPSGGVTVTLSKTKTQTLKCQQVDLARYFSNFSQLAASLETRTRQKNMLLRFYSQADK